MNEELLNALATVTAELDDARADAIAKAADDADLQTLVTEYVELDATVRKLEAATDKWKKARDRYRKELIPAAMRDAGIVVGNTGSFTSKFGTVYLSTREFITVNAANVAAYKEWLTTHGRDPSYFFKTAVDSGPLRGVVEELRDDNTALPEFISVHEETTAAIRGLANLNKV